MNQYLLYIFAGCTDIDDALHSRVLENGNWEFGVHIADVSHSVRPNNAMDKEAANRCTSVYLSGIKLMKLSFISSVAILTFLKVTPVNINHL